MIDLGLPIGEVYLLLDKFKNTTSFDSKKQKLQCLIRNIKTTKVTRVVKETLQVHLKWHNFNEKKNKFAMVRAENGGGNRVQQMSRTCSLIDVTTALKNIFFPNGRNRNGQSLDFFSHYVGDSGLTKLSSDIFDGKEPFTLNGYITQSCLKKATFVLVTTKLSSHKFLINQYPQYLNNSDSDASSLVMMTR